MFRVLGAITCRRKPEADAHIRPKTCRFPCPGLQFAASAPGPGLELPNELPLLAGPVNPQNDARGFGGSAPMILQISGSSDDLMMHPDAKIRGRAMITPQGRIFVIHDATSPLPRAQRNASATPRWLPRKS